MFDKKKRGVSPLIATVLLIAFAVSLGAVVINLGLNLFGDPCKDKTIEILTIAGAPRVCHIPSTKTISMTIVNSGKDPLDGFKISVVGNVAYNEDIPEKFQSLEKKVISYPASDITRIDLISIIPYYEDQGEIKYCAQNEKDYTNIANC